MHNIALFAVLPLISFAMIGCGLDPAEGPLGPPSESRLLAPFAGQWVFDFEKTLTAQKAAGVTDEQIAQLRKVFADNPTIGKMHPDLTIQGNVAVGSGLLSSEYRFFAMHNHDSKVCGKAWHHEDRFDPGDMSKCYVRLTIVGEELHLEVNMLDGLPDLNDPDLVSDPPVEGELSKCDAKTKAGQKPGDWATYVFSRGS
ncbi:MAG: hypothetical protein ACKV2Q_02210 [Planctomycetaceae bacterium]